MSARVGVIRKSASSWLFKFQVPLSSGLLISGLCCFSSVTANVGVAQDYDVLCTDGNGSFQAVSHTGVKVQVTAAKTKAGQLATRKCEATLGWNGRSLIVATDASEIDLDGYGVELGMDVPVATFQVKNSADECCVDYQIYSLEKPPRLLRTLSGGDFFTAADTDLDGRVEIWTNDAAAISGFENLTANELESAPTVVLRFAQRQLLDVSSEFRPYFDSQIAEVQRKLDPEDRRDFKSSDGKLSTSSSLPAARLLRLRSVKGKVLSIIWAYLYSGREQQAWRMLQEMWPAADLERIRAAILTARSRGITAKVAGESYAGSAKSKKRARIFDAQDEAESRKLQLVPAEAIMLRRFPPVDNLDGGLLQSESLLDLVIDSAGKVRSAEPAGNTKSADANLIHAAAGWKFIPAFEAGRPVASRMRLAISLRQ